MNSKSTIRIQELQEECKNYKKDTTTSKKLRATRKIQRSLEESNGWKQSRHSYLAKRWKDCFFGKRNWTIKKSRRKSVEF